MVVRMKHIGEVGLHALCTACGGCAAVCPVGAVAMQENPAGFFVACVDEAVCVGCGLCRKVCPSISENTQKFASRDLLHGVCLEGFVGYAADEAVRLGGQSGGVVTALLCHLLRSEKIDAALVAGFDEKARRPKSVLAETEGEILASAGSYYTQVPLLSELKQGKEKRVAAVTLGCQNESLTLMETAAPGMVPLYRIGLICAGQNSGAMIDDICRKAGCDQPTAFRFRDKQAGGWPGAITVTDREGVHELPNQYRHAIKPVYECHRCLLCFDQMNSCADIVCGDPWGITGKDTPEGHTVLIARTEKGLELLKSAETAGAIVLEKLPITEIMGGQTVNDRHRDKVYAAKAMYEAAGWKYPYDTGLMESYVPDRKVMEKNEAKLKYTRTYYMAATAAEAAKLAERKKRQKPPVPVRLKKWLKTLKT